MRTLTEYCSTCDEYVEVLQNEEELYLDHVVKACGHVDHDDFIPDNPEAELNFDR